LSIVIKASHSKHEKKWSERIHIGKSAVAKVNAALRAVNEWSPKTNTAFVQQLVKESTQLYTQFKDYPLTIPSEMIQLAANDHQLKKRLFEWLNLLKGSIVESLSMAESAKDEIDALYGKLAEALVKLDSLLEDDSKKLTSAIENFTTLIKVYSQNEDIYKNLGDQNSLLTTANTKWCAQEKLNYQTNHKNMENQLKVFAELRIMFNKHYSRVHEWIKKKFN